jgi:hypothetical protein
VSGSDGDESAPELVLLSSLGTDTRIWEPSCRIPLVVGGRGAVEIVGGETSVGYAVLPGWDDTWSNSPAGRQELTVRVLEADDLPRTPGTRLTASGPVGRGKPVD